MTTRSRYAGRCVAMGIVVSAMTSTGLAVAAGEDSSAQTVHSAVRSCESLRATIVGSEGDDVIVGTPGDDVITALSGNDVIRGLGGQDVLCGDEGRDVVRGGPGLDVIQIQAGSRGEVASGGPHDDLFQVVGLARGSILRGGLGHDELVLDANGARLVVNARSGALTLNGLASGMFDFEKYGLASDASTLFLGSARDESVRVGVDAVVHTRGGNDKISVWSDRRGPADVWDGGAGRDLLVYSTFDSKLRVVDLQRHTMRRDGRLSGRVFVENVHVISYSGPVTIYGSDGPNRFGGIATVLRLVGRGGNDVMRLQQEDHQPHVSMAYGGPGRDLLRGSWGPDTLIGGPGVDTTNGGHGVDLCRAEHRIRCERG